MDALRLYAVNDIEELMIATRHTDTAVKAGDKLAGMRVIPLVIEEKKPQRGGWADIQQEGGRKEA